MKGTSSNPFEPPKTIQKRPESFRAARSIRFILLVVLVLISVFSLGMRIDFASSLMWVLSASAGGAGAATVYVVCRRSQNDMLVIDGILGSLLLSILCFHAFDYKNGRAFIVQRAVFFGVFGSLLMLSIPTYLLDKRNSDIAEDNGDEHEK